MNGHRQMNPTSSKLTIRKFDFKLNSLGRILTDVPCKVCHDNSSGKHYGIFACDG
jgi:hypothetical protein